MHDTVISHLRGIGGRRLGRDIALRGAVHAPMHDVETAGKIGVSASAVGEHQLESGKTVEHSGHQQRADAERGVEGVLCNLGEREFRGTRRRADQNGVDQHGQPERFGLAPERLERQLAEIDVLDIGGDDHAACPEQNGTRGFLRRGLCSRERNGGDPGEAIRIVHAPGRQRVVEHAMPGDARVGGKTVAKYIGPGADDLSLDPLRIEPSAPLGDGLVQARKDRPYLKAVIEMQGRRRAVGFNYPHPDLSTAEGDCVDQLRRNVVGMNVNRHAGSHRGDISIRGSTARKIEDGAGAERAVFRRQPSHERSDLLRLSEPPQRDLGQHVVDMRLRHWRQQGLAHRGRCDAIYVDRSIGQFLAQRFRKGNDRGLAGAVGGRIRVTVLAGNRGNVDDTTIISLTHQRHDRPAAVERPLDVDREDSLPVIDRILPQLGVGSADSSVVDEYVDRGHDPERLLHGNAYGRRIAHVGADARGAELFAGNLRGLAVEVPDHDSRARCDKALGYRESQSRCATRHDGATPIEIQLIHCLRLALSVRMAMSAASNSAARVAPTDAIPRPAMSYAVPCAGVQIGKGKPPRSVTPRSKPISFIAIWPWSWYIVSTASNAPFLARRKTVSAGNGPSTQMPSRLPASTTGAITSISSQPKLPPSPACGLSPATAMRGCGKPALRMQASVKLNAREIRSLVNRAGTSAREMCEVTRAFHNLSRMLNSLAEPCSPTTSAEKAISSS